MKIPEHTFWDLKKKGTKIKAGVLAAFMILGTGIGISKLTKDVGPETIEIVTEEHSIDEELYNLYLSEDFDINNKEEVRKRAEAIYELSVKLEASEDKMIITVDDIINIIYMVNGKYENITLKAGLNDKEKAEYVRDLSANMIFNLLNNGTRDIFNAAAGIIKLEKVPELVYSYMFMANQNKAKQYALELGTAYVDLLNSMVATPDKYVELVKQYNKVVNEIINSFNKEHKESDKSDSLTLSDGEIVLIIDDINSKSGLVDVSTIENDRNAHQNNIWANLSKKLGINVDELINENEANCNETKVTNGSSYNQKDAVDAEEYVDNEKDTTKVVQQGGKNEHTEVVTVPGTTHVETSSYVVSVPSTGISESVEHGGQVTGTTTIVIEDGVPNENVGVEVIEPGGEELPEETGTIPHYEDDDNGLSVEANGKVYRFSIPTAIK